MFKNMKTLFITALIILTITGCSGGSAPSEASPPAAASIPAQSSSSADSRANVEAFSGTAVSSTAAKEPSSSTTDIADDSNSEAEASAPADGSSEDAAPPEAVDALAVHFGDDGAAFTMNLYNNNTAAAIADYVGTADWRLPINNYDDYENWEVMQFYDIPSRYEIPANTETVTSQKAGEVYYSDPNRIVLFYQDAEVTGEYTRVGYFNATENFVSAVQNNPVLEGWGNKIVLIKD